MMVFPGENIVLPLPEKQFRTGRYYNVGDHRLVKVIYGDEDVTDWKWQCFEHGPECWVTVAIREYEKTYK